MLRIRPDRYGTDRYGIRIGMVRWGTDRGKLATKNNNYCIIIIINYIIVIIRLIKYLNININLLILKYGVVVVTVYYII